MRPEMLAGDPLKGIETSAEIEAAPLPVKIRYLCEFWTSDVTRNLDRLQVPVLVLVAGFDEKFLSDSANNIYKDGLRGFMGDFGTQTPADRTREDSRHKIANS